MSSLQEMDKKLDRCLAKNQHSQSKSLCFVNTHIAESSKSVHHFRNQSVLKNWSHQKKAITNKCAPILISLNEKTQKDSYGCQSKLKVRLTKCNNFRWASVSFGNFTTLISIVYTPGYVIFVAPALASDASVFCIRLCPLVLWAHLSSYGELHEMSVL